MLQYSFEEHIWTIYRITKKWANLCPFALLQNKMLKASGGGGYPPEQGLCPWTCWGSVPGTNYRLVFCPTFNRKFMPICISHNITWNPISVYRGGIQQCLLSALRRFHLIGMWQTSISHLTTFKLQTFSARSKVNGSFKHHSSNVNSWESCSRNYFISVKQTAFTSVTNNFL